MSDNYVCPICFYHGPFEDSTHHPTPLKRKSAFCPQCHSKETSRLLRLILNQLYRPLGLKNKSCAHFSPVNPEYSGMFFGKYRQYNKKNVDIDLSDTSYVALGDVFIAIHVLEHIKEDDKALANIAEMTNYMAILPVPNFYDEMKELDEMDTHSHWRQTKEEYYSKMENYFPKVVLVRSSDYPDIYQTRILTLEGDIYEEVFPLCFR